MTKQMKSRLFWVAIVPLTALAGLDLVAAQGRGVPGGVAFNSARDGNNEIFVADSNGRNPVNLTNSTANDGWAQWSPNGSSKVIWSLGIGFSR